MVKGKLHDTNHEVKNVQVIIEGIKNHKIVIDR